MGLGFSWLFKATKTEGHVTPTMGLGFRGFQGHKALGKYYANNGESNGKQKG